MENIIYLVYAVFLIIFSFIFLYIVFREFSQLFFGYGVPYVAISDFKLDKLLDNIEIKENQKFIDLGSGDGRVLEAVYKRFPGIKLYGVENSPIAYRDSMKRKKEKNISYTIYKKDFFSVDLSNYDVIYSYTITYLMEKIWKKIKAECKSGTLFYSNSFEVKGEKVYKKIKTTKNRFIYVYKV